MKLRYIGLLLKPFIQKKCTFSSYVSKHSLIIVDDVLSTEDEALITPLLDALLAKKRYEGTFI